MTYKQLKRQLESELEEKFGSCAEHTATVCHEGESGSDFPYPDEYRSLWDECRSTVSVDETSTEMDDIIGMGAALTIDDGTEKEEQQNDIRGSSVDLWLADGVDELSFALRRLVPTLAESVVPKWDDKKSVMFLVVPATDKDLIDKVVDFDPFLIRRRVGSIEDELYKHDGCARAIVIASSVLSSRRVLISATRCELIQTDQREPGVDAALKVFSGPDGRRVLFVAPYAAQFGVLRPGIWWDTLSRDGRFHIVMCNLDRIRDTGRDATSPARGAMKLFREHASKFYPGAWRWECGLKDHEKCERRIFGQLLARDDEGLLGRLRNWQPPYPEEDYVDAKEKYRQQPTPTLRTGVLRFYLKLVEDAVTTRSTGSDAIDVAECEKVALGLYEFAAGMSCPMNSTGQCLYQCFLLVLARTTADSFVKNVQSEIARAMRETASGDNVYAALSCALSPMQLLSECIRKFSVRASRLMTACSNLRFETPVRRFALPTCGEGTSGDLVSEMLLMLESPSISQGLKTDVAFRNEVSQLHKKICEDKSLSFKEDDAVGMLHKILKKRMRRHETFLRKAESLFPRIEKRVFSPLMVDLLRKAATVTPEAVLQIDKQLSF